MRRWRFALLVVLGLAVSLVATLLVFGLPLGPSLGLLFEGAFGDKFGVARTLVKAIPLTLAGLGMVIAWRAGMYNIGGEGQLLTGAVSGAAVAKLLAGLSGALLNPLILLGAVAGGAAWAGIAGWLYVKRGVQVVISTILLNFVALQVMLWAVSDALQQASRQLPLTERLPEDAMLQRFDPQTDLHAGLFVALFMVVLIAVYLFLTKGGFRLRLVGENAQAARAARIEPGAVHIRAMLLSGALCGLAGGIEYVGITGQVGQGISQQWGFLAIPVALLGGLHPVGVLFSALYFGALFAGSENLARFTASGTTLVLVIQAVAVLALVGFRAALERRARMVGEVA